ncbi:MAG: DNA repair protein RecN [bacterium]|nr:DNA repair protein RecN [bacterium]
MLLNLHVKNFAIIDEIDVCFNDHLNILTGETGAGKSIILGSINIALGGKVNKEIIRKGADYALVELVFQIDDLHTVEALKELDIEVSDHQIIISRKIMNGRVVNKINGENVPGVMLKKVAELLLDIHGQHEHQSLLYKTKHLSIVDQFGKTEIRPLKKELAFIYRKYQEVVKELNETSISEEQKLREVSFLEYEINEIESANLKPDEDESLQEEYKRLANANTISENLSSIYDMSALSNTSISENISRSIRLIQRVSEFDKRMEQFASQLMDIEGIVTDFNRDISEYMSDLEYDPREFNQIEDRLNLINNLKAKYGNSVSEVLEYLENAREKLEKYTAYDEYIESLLKQKKEIEEQLEYISEKISVLRKKNAKELQDRITEALLDLNFMNVNFQVAMNKLPRYTEQGFDEIEFLISTNLGEDVKPLSKVASGGELSRIMLAIKSVLADQDSVGTLIFDEIDVGVSGRTAQKVSERMAVISKKHQVLCITHLPQIASMADSHYIIEKTQDSVRTTTNIYQLNNEQSIEELARMLGGVEITETVLSNAKEMKDLAKKTKLY